MTDLQTPSRPSIVAVLGGCLYATLIISWAFMTGFQLAADSLLAGGFALSYAAVGMFSIAAIPLYLLGRFSIVSPTFVAAWSLGNTMYLRWYVPRPHDALASYLTVWPLFVGLICVAAIFEGGIRFAAKRTIDELGFQSLW